MHKTYVVIFMACTYAVVAFLIAGSVFYFAYTKGNELENRVQTIVNASVKLKVYKELWVQYEASAPERALLAEFALTEDEVGTFLTEIEKIGITKGVLITTNSLKIDKKPDTPDKLLIQFALEGDMFKIKQMIELFETVPYHSLINTLIFATEENGLVKATVDLSITLVKYDK